MITHQPTHAYDMYEHFKSAKVMRKPILLMEIDGTQDEAPWYSKPLATAISLFKEVDLVVFLHGVNASDLSEFNLVERRIALLSHEIAECYFFTIPLEIIQTQVEKLLTVNWRRTSWRQHEFLLKCGQRQSLMITK